MTALPPQILVVGTFAVVLVAGGVVCWLLEERRRRADGPRRCVRCGCTEDQACPGGCWWVSFRPPICSRCS